MSKDKKELLAGVTGGMKPIGEVTTAKALFARPEVMERFEKILDDKAPGFISSVLMVVNESKALDDVDPMTIFNAAATAAVLDLPLDKSLGMAYIVPYKKQAQFQLGYKGLIQLALRTEQYLKINAIPVYESQFHSWQPLMEILDADFTKPKTGAIHGYCAFFTLRGGFSKVVYWTEQEVQAHATRFSQAYRSNRSDTPWDTDKLAMSLKTVLKYMLNLWGPKSISLNLAMSADQSVQRKGGEFEYVDNEKDEPASLAKMEFEKEEARIVKYIDDAQSALSLSKVKQAIDERENNNDLVLKYEAGMVTLLTKEIKECTTSKGLKIAEALLADHADNADLIELYESTMNALLLKEEQKNG